MKDKFYAFLFLSFFIGALTARAQDSAACNARFGAEVNGSQVYFRAVDSLAGVEHYWNFGDTSQVGYGHFVAVQHSYTHSGNFTVIHRIRNTATGCQDSSIMTVSIDLNPSPSCSVAINFRWDTLDHTRYIFTATTFVPGGVVDTLLWKVDSSYAGMGDSLVRTLSNGMHRVCVTMYSSAGCRSESCVTFVAGDSAVSVPMNPGGPVQYADCMIDFNVAVNPSNPKELHFSVQDSARYDSIHWTIRVWDGHDSVALAQAGGSSFTYTFPHPGFYDVLLDAGSWKDSVSRCYSFYMQRINVDSAANSYIPSYPNPTTSQAGLDVKLSQPQMIYIRVYNSMGDPVLSTKVSGLQGTNHVQVPVNGLGSGIYYIQVQIGQESKMSKFQKL